MASVNRSHHTYNVDYCTHAVGTNSIGPFLDSGLSFCTMGSRLSFTTHHTHVDLLPWPEASYYTAYLVEVRRTFTVDFGCGTHTTMTCNTANLEVFTSCFISS